MSLALSKWLSAHRLGDLFETLLAHGVDMDVVPALSENDLIEIGVTLGQRKRFLIAATELSNNLASERREATTKSEIKPERRQLTVLFCDLVGSTALSEKLDPEEMRELLQTYQTVCQTAAARFGGFIAQYLGDGVVIYFGYPDAHESDAQNAAQSALEILARLADIRNHALQVRIGISMGEVVVGDLLVEGEHKQHSVIGQTPNLAARLMAEAEAGQIVVSESIYRLLFDLFEFREIGRRTLKGFSRAEHLWQILGRSQVASRSQVVHVQNYDRPLVAREFEISRLDQSWEKTKRGIGQVVLISGEAGIGKSRLVRDFSDRLKGEGYLVELAFCASNFQNTILYPFREKIEREIEASQGAESADLTTFDHGHPENKLDTIFRYLLDRYIQSEALDASADQRRSKLLYLVERYISDYAKDGPAILIIEDLHWCDSTTMELLGRLILDRAENLPLLILITFRTGFSVDWPEEDYFERLILKRLSPDDCRGFLNYLNDDIGLPENVIDDIVEKTDRVPLYIEEVFKATRENFDFHENSGKSSGFERRSRDVTVPDSLAASLMERLDRLGRVKRVAQIAATIGPSFSTDVLTKISTFSASALDEALDQLVRSEIILPRADATESTYNFRHALLREVAYSSLLKSERQQLHARIASALEAEVSQGAPVDPELLGHHYSRAGMVELAIDCFQTAGARAFENSAYREATEHVSNGLDLIRLLQDGNHKNQSEVNLRTTLAQALHALKGGGAKEVAANYERARNLNRIVDNPSKYFSVLIGCWTNSFISADLNNALEISGEILDLAQSTPDPALLAEAQRVRGMTLLYMGDFNATREFIDDALENYALADRRLKPIQHGPHPLICSESYLAHALLFLGFRDLALGKIGNVIQDARGLRHAYTETFSLAFSAFFHQTLEDKEATAKYSSAAIGLASKHGFEFWAKQQTVLSRWAECRLGDDRNLAAVQNAIDAYLDLGSHLESTRFLTLTAEAYEHSAQGDHSLSLLKHAMNIAERSGEKFYLAETHRILAKIYSSRSDLPSKNLTISHFRHALEMSQKQAALIWLLKTARSVAEYGMTRTGFSERSQRLADLCECYCGGGDTTPILDCSRELLTLLED